MLVKKSVVKNIQPNGTWNGKFGEMFKFEIEMNNGDIGEYSSKFQQQTKFSVGNEVEYEWHDGQYPKIKPHTTFVPNDFKSSPMGNTTKDLMIVRQSSLKVAVDCCKSDSCSPSDVINIAEEFVNWVMDGKKPSQENPF